MASFGKTAQLLATLPSAVDDVDFACFAEQGDRDVQLVQRRGATTVLFAFTGRYGGVGIPRPILHRWVGQAGVHVVYLCDFSDRIYHEGIVSLAADRAGTIHTLRAIVARLGPTRTVTYGNSSGGYSALLYASEIPAAAVLAFGAITEATPATLQARAGDRKALVALQDLRPLYQTASCSPKVRLVFGETNDDDAAAAENLAGIPGVTLHPVACCSGHDTPFRIVEQGRMGELLTELVEGRAARHGGTRPYRTSV